MTLLSERRFISRNHWSIDAGLPPIPRRIGGGEGVYVTLLVDVQLPSICDADVTLYGPRAEGRVDHLLMVADQLKLPRQTLVVVLSAELNAEISNDSVCLDLVATLGASFTQATSTPHVHTLSDIAFSLASAVRRVTSTMVTLNSKFKSVVYEYTVALTHHLEPPSLQLVSACLNQPCHPESSQNSLARTVRVLLSESSHSQY